MTTSYIFTDFDNLALTIDNVPYAVDSSHQNWQAILDALKDSNFDAIPSLINQSKAIAAFVGLNNIEVNTEYGTITYHGEPLHNTIVDHIFRLMDEGFDINPMVRFLDNLMSNPSRRAVNELYSFLQAGQMPITEDGCFIAYKRVRSDYKSVHDGKTDNTPGTRLDMPRNLVDENSEQTCSTGLHFCSHAYLKHFSGDKVVILKVNPRDVVSIPADYNDTKGRACGYDIIGELTPEQVKEALETNVFTEAVYRTEVAKDNIGPRESAGQFARGYQRGYEAMKAGNGFDPDDYDGQTGLTDGQQDAYWDGYDKGWEDAQEGAPAMWVWTGTKPAPTATSTDPKAGFTSFYYGYEAGYRDGHNDYTYDDGNTFFGRECDAYEAGYGKGYEDGVVEHPKRYTTNVLETASGKSQYDARQLYDAGYRDGRDRTTKRYTDADYIQGYKDGRSHRPRKYK